MLSRIQLCLVHKKSIDRCSINAALLDRKSIFPAPPLHRIQFQILSTNTQRPANRAFVQPPQKCLMCGLCGVFRHISSFRIVTRPSKFCKSKYAMWPRTLHVLQTFYLKFTFNSYFSGGYFIFRFFPFSNAPAPRIFNWFQVLQVMSLSRVCPRIPVNGGFAPPVWNYNNYHTTWNYLVYFCALLRNFYNL